MKWAEGEWGMVVGEWGMAVGEKGYSGICWCVGVVGACGCCGNCGEEVCCEKGGAIVVYA